MHFCLQKAACFVDFVVVKEVFTGSEKPYAITAQKNEQPKTDRTRKAQTSRDLKKEKPVEKTTPRRKHPGKE